MMLVSIATIACLILYFIIDDVTMETSPASNDPWQPNETGLPAKIARNESEDETTPLLIADAKATPIESEATPLLMAGGASKVVIMEWHTCVICLEEMIDSELMTHESCGATLCSNCIEASVRHSSSESGHIPCPVSHVTHSCDVSCDL